MRSIVLAGLSLAAALLPAGASGTAKRQLHLEHGRMLVCELLEAEAGLPVELEVRGREIAEAGIATRDTAQFLKDAVWTEGVDVPDLLCERTAGWRAWWHEVRKL